MSSEEVVHQTKALKRSELTTKCGLVGHVDRIRHSSWHSEITCRECLGE